jgi:tetratricopeptide (TPR) repeat protein
MAQHKFHEALKLSEEIYRENPKYTLALANIGDAQLELGRYDEAEKTFQELKKKTPGDLPEVLARLARIAELRGRTEEAISLLAKALEQERASRPNSSELAWYDSCLGEVYFHSNQLDKANQHYQASLERREKYVPALLGLGQVRAAQGRHDEAAALYEQVVAQKPDVDHIGDLAVLYSLAGNQAKSKELEEKAISLIPVAAKVETEARHLALFLADREIQLDLALESARKELKVREDVFAYDVLAWALFKSGQTQAAWDAMQNAFRIGTKDARMHFHAGMIARGLGRPEVAQEHLSKALEINPHFGFTEPKEALKVLAELKAQ